MVSFLVLRFKTPSIGRLDESPGFTKLKLVSRKRSSKKKSWAIEIGREEVVAVVFLSIVGLTGDNAMEELQG